MNIVDGYVMLIFQVVVMLCPYLALPLGQLILHEVHRHRRTYPLEYTVRVDHVHRLGIQPWTKPNEG